MTLSTDLPVSRFHLTPIPQYPISLTLDANFALKKQDMISAHGNPGNQHLFCKWYYYDYSTNMSYTITVTVTTITMYMIILLLL